MKILVSADTSCVVLKNVLEKNNVNVFPLNVIIDGVEYLDGVSIDQDKLLTEMNANKVVKTSTPPLGQVIEYFEDLFEQGYDHIIHFTISSKLSSMFDLFTNVANTEFEGKLTIIDSLSVSSLMLSHVLFAVDEVRKGTPVEVIVAKIEARKMDNYVCFIPKNLTTLKNGGRISPAIAAIGNTIGLKPLITLKEGALVKDSMIRHMKKAFIEKITENYGDYPISKYDYTIVSFDSNQNIVDAIVELIEKIDSNYSDYKVIKGIIPINVCAHCGPGTIGLLVTPKINGKSLQEFM